MDHIDEHRATAAENSCNSVTLLSALAIGKQTLNKSYNKTDYSEVYQIAMGKFKCSPSYFAINSPSIPLVRHLHHKLKYFESTGWQEDWIATA
jgi:hypothetical protein